MTAPEQARRLLAEVLGVDAGALDETASAETLEAWDSLAHMRLVLRLEEELGRQLTADEILEATSLPEVAVLLAD